jgi:hypothetical protein
MGPTTPIPIIQSQLTLGDHSFLGVLGDSLLLFAVALFLLTFLGAPIAAIVLPESLRRSGWLFTPYLGYSLLVVVSGWFVATGANMEESLIASLALATLASCWAVYRGGFRSMGSPVNWLLLPALAIPSYAITAISMAHNGSLAYVGGQADIYLLIPLAQWLTSHSAPLFSLSSPNLLFPFWNANVPPMGNWLDPNAHLAFQGHRGDDTNFLLQRGPVYLQASLSLLLGWDAFRVFRPAQAFALALAAPSTFIFSRLLLRATPFTSVLAAAFMALNGTAFFWVAFAHPGQASGFMLFPVAIILTIAAIESTKPLHAVAAALLLSSIIISYYQGAPLFVFLLAPPSIYLLVKSHNRRHTLLVTTLIAALTLLLTLPEQIKLILIWMSGTLSQTSGWGDSDLASVGDAFGTTLFRKAFLLVAGQGQLPESTQGLLSVCSSIATAVAGLLALGGIVWGRAAGTARLRSIAVGATILLVGLSAASYSYGYAKALASVTFLFAAATALGTTTGYEILNRFRLQGTRLRPASRFALPAVGLLAILLVLATNGINLSLAAYAFWKPVGNMWDPRSWDVSSLTESLAPGEGVRLTPNAMTNRETTYITLYLLRNQRLEEAPVLEGMLGREVLLLTSDQDTVGAYTGPGVEILGASEISAMRGLTAGDLLWNGSFLKAYTHRQSSPAWSAIQQPAENGSRELPSALPVEFEIKPGGGTSDTSPTPGPAGRLLLTVASESSMVINARENGETRSLEIGKGVSVRSIPITSVGQVRLETKGPGRALILSASIVGGGETAAIHEDYPKVLAAAASSSLNGTTIFTRLDYLDVGVPVSHSLDLFDAGGSNHVAWFELPTNPDERIKDIGFTLDPTTLRAHSTVDGVDEPRPSNANMLGDGEYVAYFTIWAGQMPAKRIPLYRYRLTGGAVAGFEGFPLNTAWDGEAIERTGDQ